MKNKIFIGRDGDLEQISEDEIQNQQPYGKFVDYVKFKVREIELEVDDRMQKKLNEEELGRKVVEQLREEDDANKEFEELTDEEQSDLDEIFNIIDSIGDRVVKTVVKEYFRIKEKKERREKNEY